MSRNESQHKRCMGVIPGHPIFTCFRGLMSCRRDPLVLGRYNNPEEDYVDLSNDMVNYANGLPLALKVLGSSLHGRSVLQWEKCIAKTKNKTQY